MRIIDDFRTETDLLAPPAIDEIQAILARRKRLLTELFFLSKYVEVPQEYAHGEAAARAVVDSEDLSAFLAENDLESGKIFDERTLPDKVPSSVDASTQLELSKLHVPDTQQEQNPKSRSIVTSGTSGSGLLLQDNQGSRHDSHKVAHATFDHITSDATAADLQQPMSLSTTRNEAPLLHKQVIVVPKTNTASKDFDTSSWLYRTKETTLLGVVQVARKSMSTENWSAALTEQRFIKSLERVEALKSSNQWSLRQPSKQKSAPKRKAHWDFLLDEMQWLRSDFREERKWKIALARKLAFAVREWHESSNKSALTINARAIESRTTEDVQMKDQPLEYEPPTPPSGSDDVLPDFNLSREVERQDDIVSAKPVMVHSPPLSAIDDSANVFETANEDVYAYLNEVPGRASPSLVPDLPIFGPPVPADVLYEDPLNSMTIISTSKLAQSSLRVRNPRKRAFIEDEAVEMVRIDFERGTPSSHARRKSSQAPMAIRPPFVPSNLERRIAERKDHHMVWTNEADDMLLHLLNEYQYNWEFVAQVMTPANMVCAVADRKSPWDCFERWIQIDPRSTDVIFTGAHAKLVQSRVDDMVRTPRPPGPLKRSSSSHNSRIPPNEHKRQRQFSMFEVMRKVQRKRENQPKAALPKKPVPDATKTPPIVPTPQDLSRMKWERDQQIARAFHESKNQQLQALQQQRLMQQQQQQHHQQQQQQHQQQQQQQQLQKGSPQPSQAQIAQMQAARQTQHRAQLAQQTAANGNGSIVNGASPSMQINRGPVAGPRPSLVGQLPARPMPGPSGTTTMHKTLQTMPNGQLPTSTHLRFPPGPRLNQEQMNQLLAQARQQRGLSSTPTNGLQMNGSLINGHAQQMNGQAQAAHHMHNVGSAGSPAPNSGIPLPNTSQQQHHQQPQPQPQTQQHQHQQQTQAQVVSTPKTPMTPKTPHTQSTVLQKEPQSEAAR